VNAEGDFKGDRRAGTSPFLFEVANVNNPAAQL